MTPPAPRGDSPAGRAYLDLRNLARVADRIRTIVGRDSIKGDTIRDDADYPGVRVKLLANLATAHIPLHVDVNFGDPIWPAPAETDLPLLLSGTLRLRTYPDHMVLAEKIVTAIDRGTANTRWRDFVDVAAITASRSIQQNHLAVAIKTVARHRRVTMMSMATALDGLAVLAQPRWAAWRRKQRLEATTPERFADLLDQCSAFADHVLDGGGDDVWSPDERAWLSPAAR